MSSAALRLSVIKIKTACQFHQISIFIMNQMKKTHPLLRRLLLLPASNASVSAPSSLKAVARLRLRLLPAGRASMAGCASSPCWEWVDTGESVEARSIEDDR